ncbi:armadillo-like helical domain-containing protein 2 [Amia ocellicauda]|uniref:armadillo-like helical domain-containing protein 2 n=1 Tax=Amia ocellicauda TaxID=2972642 RepID=UPI0034639833
MSADFTYKNLSPREQESEPVKKDILIHKIILAGKNIRNTSLSLDKRIQAASDIGVLAYTGGRVAAMYAGEYMPYLAAFLTRPDLSTSATITILKTLSGISYTHHKNQQKAMDLNLCDMLLGFLHQEEDPLLTDSPKSILVKFWTCYLLSVLCWNNIPQIRLLSNSQSLRRDLEILRKKRWDDWPNNYAQELVDLLGFSPSHPQIFRLL